MLVAECRLLTLVFSKILKHVKPGTLDSQFVLDDSKLLSYWLLLLLSEFFNNLVFCFRCELIDKDAFRVEIKDLNKGSY